MPGSISLAPGHPDETLCPYFALAIIIILVLLFIDFHKLFTEQVKYYCNYGSYDDNDNKNNYY